MGGSRKDEGRGMKDEWGIRVQSAECRVRSAECRMQSAVLVVWCYLRRRRRRARYSRSCLRVGLEETAWASWRSRRRGASPRGGAGGRDARGGEVIGGMV